MFVCTTSCWPSTMPPGSRSTLSMAQSSSTNIPIPEFSIGILTSALLRNASMKRPRAQKVSAIEVGVDLASECVELPTWVTD